MQRDLTPLLLIQWQSFRLLPSYSFRGEEGFVISVTQWLAVSVILLPFSTVLGPVRSTIYSLPLPSQQNRLGNCENRWKLVSGGVTGLAAQLAARASFQCVRISAWRNCWDLIGRFWDYSPRAHIATSYSSLIVGVFHNSISACMPNQCTSSLLPQ